MNDYRKSIKVWDLLVRVFHWSLVSFFLIAYISGDDFEFIHTWSGYAIAGLIVFRLVWGMIGTKYARFYNFIKSPTEVRSYLKSLLAGQAKRYLGLFASI